MVQPVNMNTQRALVLAHEPKGTSALVGKRLRERGYQVHEHVVTPDESRPNDATPFPEVDRYDVLVLMGSVRSLTDTDPIDSWIFEEINLVRSAHQRGTPVLGVCFGGQLLAAALGGQVETAPEPEIGWYEIYAVNGSVEAASTPENPVGSGPWFQWHHDRFTPPPGAETLAANDYANQLFRIGRSVGTQFHPEVTPAHLKGFLKEVPDDYRARYGIDPTEMLKDMARHEKNNAAQCAALVDWFLDSTPIELDDTYCKSAGSG